MSFSPRFLERLKQTPIWDEASLLVQCCRQEKHALGNTGSLPTRLWSMSRWHIPLAWSGVPHIYVYLIATLGEFTREKLKLSRALKLVTTISGASTCSNNKQIFWRDQLVDSLALLYDLSIKLAALQLLWLDLYQSARNVLTHTL